MSLSTNTSAVLPSPLESFWNPNVLWLTFNYFAIVTASVGMLLFLPQIIKPQRIGNAQTKHRDDA